MAAKKSVVNPVVSRLRFCSKFQLFVLRDGRQAPRVAGWFPPPGALYLPAAPPERSHLPWGLTLT